MQVDDCDFSKSSFDKCNMTDFDFSSSRIDNIRIDYYSLKGVILNQVQSLSVVKLLGVKIKE